MRSGAGEGKRLIRVHSRSFAAVFCLPVTLTLSAETHLSLQQAGSRMAPDWTPVYDGKEVTGQWPSFRAANLGIRIAVFADSGPGRLRADAEGSKSQLRDLAPGDWVECARAHLAACGTGGIDTAFSGEPAGHASRGENPAAFRSGVFAILGSPGHNRERGGARKRRTPQRRHDFHR